VAPAGIEVLRCISKHSAMAPSQQNVRGMKSGMVAGISDIVQKVTCCACTR